MQLKLEGRRRGARFADLSVSFPLLQETGISDAGIHPPILWENVVVKARGISTSAGIDFSGYFARAWRVRITPFDQFVDRDHMNSLRRDINRDIAEAQIVIEHLLVAHTLQAQPSRLQNAGLLDSD